MESIKISRTILYLVLLGFGADYGDDPPGVPSVGAGTPHRAPDIIRAGAFKSLDLRPLWSILNHHFMRPAISSLYSVHPGMRYFCRQK